MSILLINDSYL